MNEKTKNTYQEFNAFMIQQINASSAPFQVFTKGEDFLKPYNPINNYQFYGLNKLMLHQKTLETGDPRWFRWGDLQNENLWIKKDEKSSKIINWHKSKNEFQPETIFNASQLENGSGYDLAEYVRPPSEEHPFEIADKIIANSGVEFVIDNNNKVDFQNNRIHIKDKEHFANESAYYCKAVAMLAGISSSPQHLQRPVGKPGTEAFAAEKLRGKLATWMVCQEIGLDFHPEVEPDYSPEWASIIKKEMFELSNAAKDAEKIKSYFLGRARGMAQDGQELGSKPKEPKEALGPVEEFAQVLKRAGFKLDGPPILNGQPQTCNVAYGNKGIYKGVIDQAPQGEYQNFNNGERGRWRYSGHALTEESITELQTEAQKRHEERQEKQEALYVENGIRALEKYRTLPTPSPNNSILSRWKIQGRDVREDEHGNLVIPGVLLKENESNGLQYEFQTFQIVKADGKDYAFERGTKAAGAMYVADVDNQIASKNAPIIYITDSYMEATTISEATNKPAIAVFDVRNMGRVIEQVKNLFPDSQIRLCARVSQLDKASEIAAQHSLEIIVPQFKANELKSGMDGFSDVLRVKGGKGLELIKNEIEKTKAAGMER